VSEEVLDADAEVVVGVEEAGGAGDDAVAVMVGVGREATSNFSLLAIIEAMAYGLEQSMRMRRPSRRS